MVEVFVLRKRGCVFVEIFFDSFFVGFFWKGFAKIFKKGSIVFFFVKLMLRVLVDIVIFAKYKGLFDVGVINFYRNLRL